MYIVNLEKVRKKIIKLPPYIKINLFSWIDAIELVGILETRKLPGYHDEPLKGRRAHQRSVRLSRSYRVIYEVSKLGNINIVMIQEVNKHEY